MGNQLHFLDAIAAQLSNEARWTFREYNDRFMILRRPVSSAAQVDTDNPFLTFVALPEGMAQSVAGQQNSFHVRKDLSHIPIFPLQRTCYQHHIESVMNVQ